jgi:hypothetical protein
MRTKDIFGLVIRLTGLWFLYQSLSGVPTAIAGIFPVFPHYYVRNIVPSLLLVGWPLLLAYWFLRGAPPLMRLAYPEQPEPPQPGKGPYPGASATGPQR